MHKWGQIFKITESLNKSLNRKIGRCIEFIAVLKKLEHLPMTHLWVCCDTNRWAARFKCLVYHRYSILTGIRNEQEFHIHPRYALKIQLVRTQRARRRTRHKHGLTNRVCGQDYCSAKTEKFYVQQRIQSTRKTDVWSKIFFQHSYPCRTVFLLEDKSKTRPARVYLLTEEGPNACTKRGRTAWLSRAIALHRAWSRIEIALSSQGHVRTNVLSAKNRANNN